MSSRKHEVPNELTSSLFANYKRPEDLIGESGLLKQLTKLPVEKPNLAYTKICTRSLLATGFELHKSLRMLLGWVVRVGANRC